MLVVLRMKIFAAMGSHITPLPKIMEQEKQEGVEAQPLVALTGR